jgi:hypothetical protein
VLCDLVSDLSVPMAAISFNEGRRTAASAEDRPGWRRSVWGWWRSLPPQLLAGAAVALLIQGSHFLVMEKEFPFYSPYTLYAPEFLIVGTVLGYSLSEGKLLRCRCWLGVAAMQPIAFVLLQGARIGMAACFSAWLTAWTQLLFSTAVRGCVAALGGELAGTLARHVANRLLPRRAAEALARRRWFQYRLRTLLLWMTLIAVYLAYLNYYGPARIELTYQFHLTSREAMSGILAEHRSVEIAGSAFRWVVVDDEGLARLTQGDGTPREPLERRTIQVSEWEPGTGQAVTYGGNREVQMTGAPEHFTKMMASFGGSLGGFFGCRRAGMGVQLRVEATASHSGPSVKEVQPSPLKLFSCDGKIRYQGPLPRGHLVFFAPLGEDTYLLIVCDGRAVKIGR